MVGAPRHGGASRDVVDLLQRARIVGARQAIGESLRRSPHLPGFVQNASQLRDKGVDVIACLSVNDAFVMDAWGKDQSVGVDVMMLADGNGDLTKALGLEMDGTGFGMGIRSQRYAMVVDDGAVTTLNIEEPGAFEVSSAEAILAAL